jgi:hypothetical protein
MFSLSSGLRRAALPLCALALAAPITAANAEASEPSWTSSGAFYRAVLSQPLQEPVQEIASGVTWYCKGSTCLARKAGSRTDVVCVRLVRKLGPISEFVSAKEEMSADDVARCNEAA